VETERVVFDREPIGSGEPGRVGVYPERGRTHHRSGTRGRSVREAGRQAVEEAPAVVIGLAVVAPSAESKTRSPKS
jgi:hypothetical protein